MIVDIASWTCLVIGSFFCIVGGVGLLRLPDFFSRMHGTGVSDTLGAGFVLVGLMLQGGLTLVTAKLVMILAILLLTSPTGSHAVAKGARMAGLQPLLSQEDEEP